MRFPAARQSGPSRTSRVCAAGAAVLAALSAHAGVNYRVSIDTTAGELHVAACADRRYATIELRAEDGAHDYLLGFERSDQGELMRNGDRLLARDLAAGACIDYRVAAARASRSSARDGRMQATGKSWMINPGLWLWRANEAGTLTLDLPVGMHASLPWQPRDRSAQVYLLEPGGGDWPAWTVFGNVDERRIAGGDGTELRVAVIDPPSPQRAAELHAWLREVAQTTLAAYGRFPVASAQVLVLEIDSRSDSPVPWGQTTRGAGVAVELFVRRGASLAELRADWTAAHEFAHLFHPYLGNSGRWLAEGLASYYQNVLRARAGLVSEAYAWERLDAGFDRGRKSAAGTSLAQISHGARRRGGWPVMRIYWGGAAFWLEADIALHQQRGIGLEQVLAGYSSCCLPEPDRVEPDAFLARLDAISHSDIFSRLAQKHLQAPQLPSLDTSYAALGLRVSGAHAQLSDDPQARALRAKIMGERSGALRVGVR